MGKNEILQSILSLPPTDRIEIINKVFEDFDSISHDNFDKLWAEESEQRLDGYLDGSISVRSLDDVFAKINSSK